MGADAVVLLLSCVLKGASGFNLDLNHPIIYHSSQSDDYFGFALGIHPGGQTQDDPPWIMIGAPKANNIRNKGYQAGVVYKCGIKGSCKLLNSNFDDDVTTLFDANNIQYTKVPNGSMLGSVIDMTHDRYVVCSPRWMLINNDQTEACMHGACYWGSSKLSANDLELVTPLFSLNQNYREVGKDNFYFDYLWGQAGFSARLSINSRGSHEMLLGAPSVLNWIGSTVTYNDHSADAGRSHGALKAFNEGPFVPDPSRYYDIKDFGLFGYSVTMGRFFSKSQLLQIAGAPSTFPSGRVFAYALQRRGSSPKFDIRDFLDGSQVGEFFGASVAAGDINGDNLDDLVIGAPLFTNLASEKFAQDEGRVFVFLGSSQGKFLTAPLNPIIYGEVRKGRFGTVVSCVGDLDLDGFHDFALAAPFTSSGTVYIYRGSPNGLFFSQRIVGSELFPNVAGFGMSISRGQDLDKNGFSDIAIGAYKSGHAFIIRSKPVVDLTPSLVILGDKILSETAKEFEVEMCVQYSGTNTQKLIKVVITLTYDLRYSQIFQANKGSASSSVDVFEVSGGSGGEECRIVKFLIKENVNNFLAPIMITGEFALASENVNKSQVFVDVSRNRTTGQDRFCRDCPLLRRGSIIRTTEINFFRGCKNDSACVSDLQLDVNFVDGSNNVIKSYVVGSLDPVTLQVTVINVGDPSFNTRLILTLAYPPISLPPSCIDAKSTETDTPTFECDVANPLKGDDRRRLLFHFDVEKAGRKIDVIAQIESATPLANPGNTTKAASLQLLYKADITVYGKAQEESYRFELGDEEDATESKVSATGVYQVEKNGFSPLEEVVLKVNIPVRLSGGPDFLQFSRPKFYMDSRPLFCEPNDYVASQEPQKSPESHAGSSAEASSSSVLMGDVGVRAKRNTQEADLADASKFPANRTLFLNCSNGDVQCTQLVCRTAIAFSNKVASLELTMHMNMAVLEPNLGQRDIVLLFTTATVEIVKPSNAEQPDSHYPDMAHVSIVLHRRVQMGKVETWVIVLSIIGGILLLAILTAALVKAGFFQRKKRDELRIKKRQSQAAPGGPPIDGGVR